MQWAAPRSQTVNNALSSHCIHPFYQTTSYCTMPKRTQAKEESEDEHSSEGERASPPPAKKAKTVCHWSSSQETTHPSAWTLFCRQRRNRRRRGHRESLLESPPTYRLEFKRTTRRNSTSRYLANGEPRHAFSKVSHYPLCYI